jgi:hypothetical protein
MAGCFLELDFMKFARFPSFAISSTRPLLATVVTGAVLFTLAGPLPAFAGQVVLAPMSVIGDTGSYNYPGTGHPGAFPAGNIFDQQTGPIAGEAFGIGYWINGDNGPANAFITVDLGAARSGLSFELFNTSNSFNNDRGTGSFSLVGSSTIVADGADGFTLGGSVTTLVSGALTAENGPGARTAQGFVSVDTGAFRYLQVRPHSVASAVPICCGLVNNYGLNELRVFSAAVPEPTTWAMMLVGFGGLGAVLRRRRAPASPATA